MRTGIAALITGLFLSGGAFAQNVPVVDIRNGDTLAPAVAGDDHLVIAVAAKLGTTRLIDNVAFRLGKS